MRSLFRDRSGKQPKRLWGKQSEKVIYMDRFRSGKSLTPLRQAEAYWTALRDGRDVPDRSDIDPRGLENVLPYTFVLERIAPGIARFRVAGQHLQQLANLEVRGMPISAFMTAASRGGFQTTLETVFEKPAVAELSLSLQGTGGRGQSEARMILLPLRSDQGDITRALGVLVAEDTGGSVPCRFEVTSTQLRSVDGSESLMFDDSPMVPVMDPPAPVEPIEADPVKAGFAEDQAPFAPKRPTLRVVK
jgi:hypothetical protein